MPQKCVRLAQICDEQFEALLAQERQKSRPSIDGILRASGNCRPNAGARTNVREAIEDLKVASEHLARL